MDERRWRQLAASSGVAFVALAVIGQLLPGKPPSQHASAQTIVNYIADKRTALLASYVVWSAALAAFVWFFASVRTFLMEHENGERLGTIAFGGAIMTAAAALIIGVPTIAVTYRGLHTLDASVVKAIYDTNLVGLAVLTCAPAMLAIGAASIGLLRTAAMPRWIAETGLVVAALNALAISELFFSSGFWAIGGASGFVLFAVSMAWLVAVSVRLVMHYNEATAPATHAMPHPA